MVRVVVAAAGGLCPKYHPSAPLKLELVYGEWVVNEDDDKGDSGDDRKSEVLDDGIHDIKLKDERNLGCFEVGQGSGVHIEVHQLVGPELESHEDIVSKDEVHFEGKWVFVAETNGSVEEAAVSSENNYDFGEVLDFNDFHSSAEIESGSLVVCMA
ncbi:hypothetical protein C5167_026383 [Papaver somniferum]|nr:hypothetical protein C5167_026383 [Papaver somniferum]